MGDFRVLCPRVQMECRAVSLTDSAGEFIKNVIVTGQPMRAVDLSEGKSVQKRQIFISECTKTTRAFWGGFLVDSISRRKQLVPFKREGGGGSRSGRRRCCDDTLAVVRPCECALAERSSRQWSYPVPIDPQFAKLEFASVPGGIT